MAVEYPLINGLKWDYSSLEIELNGLIYVGIKEINWNQSLEPGQVRGTSAQVLADTRGEYNAEASMVMYTDDYISFIEALGDGYGEVKFAISVAFSGPGTTTRQVKLLGCRVTNEEAGGAAGPDALEVPVDLYVTQIETAGLRMIANALI